MIVLFENKILFFMTFKTWPSTYEPSNIPQETDWADECHLHLTDAGTEGS